MADTRTADHDKAFDEAWTFSGSTTVTIEGTPDIAAIVPLELSQTQEIDGAGIFQFTGQTNITIKTADLPAIDLESTVVLNSLTFRILEISQEGYLSTRLTLETP